MPTSANVLLPRYIVILKIPKHDGLAVFVTIKYLHTFGTQQRWLSAEIQYIFLIQVKLNLVTFEGIIYLIVVQH